MAEIRVPALGESVTEATIGKWFKKPGEVVAVDEPLVELETDKVTIEVPAPFSARSRKALPAPQNPHRRRQAQRQAHLLLRRSPRRQRRPRKRPSL